MKNVDTMTMDELIEYVKHLKAMIHTLQETLKKQQSCPPLPR